MLARLVSSAAVAACLLSGALAAPTRPPLPSDGFPKPNATQLDAISRLADGTLSNAPPPAKLSDKSLPAFQLIAFNENFEVAFFSSLLDNVTRDVPGYTLTSPAEKAGLVNVLQTVVAQEELHAINAANVVDHFHGKVPVPCTYAFPSTDLASALALAETFTAVVLGTLQDAAQLLAKNGDDGPVRAVASVIGQEGEQEGFYRSLLNRKPSAQPFLTTSVAAFAFSALQEFVVTCPFDLADIPIPIFPTLAVLSGQGGADVSPCDQTLQFAADLKNAATAAAPFVGKDGKGLFVTYLTGQDTPISKPIEKAHWSGSTLTFEAAFPFDEFILEGLTIAALTTAQNFSSPDDIPAKTLAAPGLIQVNDPLIPIEA